VSADAPADPSDPRRLVREGYDRASHAYRGDDADLEMSGYGHWLRRLAARVPDGARVLDLGCGNGVPATRAPSGTRAASRRSQWP
jgi:ubiquinone/menaquinone biosynthesis C-methylase UbiE